MKDLGIIIGGELNFHDHTTITTTKVNRLLDTINIHSPSMNLDMNDLPYLHKVLICLAIKYIWQ